MTLVTVSMLSFFGGKHHHIWKSAGLLVKLLSIEIRSETRWHNKTDLKHVGIVEDIQIWNKVVWKIHRFQTQWHKNTQDWNTVAQKYTELKHSGTKIHRIETQWHRVSERVEHSGGRWQRCTTLWAKAMDAQFIMMLMMRMKTAGDNGADEKEGRLHINDTRRATDATMG